MVSFVHKLGEKERENFIEYMKNLDFSKDRIILKKVEEIILKSGLFNLINEKYTNKYGSKLKIKEHQGKLNYNSYESDYKTSSLLRFSVPNENSKNRMSSIQIIIIYTPSEVHSIGYKQGWFSNDEIKIYQSRFEDYRILEEERCYDEIYGSGKPGNKNKIHQLIKHKIGDYPFNELDEEYLNFLIDFDKQVSQILKDVYSEVESFKNDVVKVLSDLDQDNNGQLDFVEGGDDYLTLLKKHQSKIIKIDRTYIQQFIKVSNYLTQKKQNLQVIFERLKDSINQIQLDELGEILKQEIHTYNIILLNSLHMINSLVEDDMITFYDIYEKFDKLNMFNSNWENEVTEKLDEVNLNLVELMEELKSVGDRIVGSIDNLSYITEQSTRQLTSKMEEIDSTLKVGNLINVIQTYQMYKVNKNTKTLRG